MANLRMLKKEIDYRLEELVFDCDMAICFQPTKEKEIFEDAGGRGSSQRAFRQGQQSGRCT